MLIFAMIFILALAAEDQLIKLYIVRNFAECKGAIRVYKTFSIGDFEVIGITHIRNDGAAWSALSGKTFFLTAVSFVAFVLILGYIFYRRRNIGKIELFSLCLFAAGGLGNLIDRARMLIEGSENFGGVIDYIKLQFMSFPVFNFADCCVTVGGALFFTALIIDEVKSSKKKRLEKAAQSAQAEHDESV